ncbi:MAG: DUF4358 domain-containing protein [Lachnospiraceae bacterium]|nr:DUF4358 domain-containing protein [Lachnospiraceae bacterium]
MEQNKTKKLTNKAIAQKGMFDEEKSDAAKKKPTNIPVTKADSVKKVRMDLRLLFLSVMGLFIVVIFGWGICQSIKEINTKEKIMEYRGTEGIKKVEDNSRKAGETIDVEALVKKVQDKVIFEAELNKLGDSVAEGMIETAEGTNLQIYVGNGTYADELIIMTAKNESDAKQNQESVKTHLSETKKAFEDYLPEEAKKIEKAVSIRCGCYVIVCVTADYETAEKTINAFIQD